jgi:hypothetical protein
MRRKARPERLWRVTVKDNKVVLGGERATLAVRVIEACSRG